MKINSEHLYEYINDLATGEKVKFKVYYDDDYVTEIYWNGESFEWDTGTFTSEAFFNPLYDFEVIEEKEETKPITKESIEALGYACREIQKCLINGWNKSLKNEPLIEEDKKIIKLDTKDLFICDNYRNIRLNFVLTWGKINEIIDKINEMENK